MTLPTWPAELPRPNREGYNFARGEGRKFSQRQGGPEVPRPGWTLVADPVALTTRLTRVQLGRFDRFYIEEIYRGLKPFLMPDPGTDGWPAHDADGSPMLDAQGEPVLMARTWLCLLTKQPSVRPFGMLWEVSFQIAVMP